MLQAVASRKYCNRWRSDSGSRVQSSQTTRTFQPQRLTSGRGLVPLTRVCLGEGKNAMVCYVREAEGPQGEVIAYEESRRVQLQFASWQTAVRSAQPTDRDTCRRS